MVDFTDLSKVNSMYSELGQIDAAIGNFDAGGRIASMTVSGGPPVPPTPPAPPEPQDPDTPTPPPTPIEPPRMSVMVSTMGWEYPEQMVTTIKGLLTSRREALVKELGELGVTGDIPAGEARSAPPPPPPAAQPAAAQPAPAPRVRPTR